MTSGSDDADLVRILRVRLSTAGAGDLVDRLGPTMLSHLAVLDRGLVIAGRP